MNKFMFSILSYGTQKLLITYIVVILSIFNTPLLYTLTFSTPTFYVRTHLLPGPTKFIYYQQHIGFPCIIYLT